jgi:thiamine-monophosphate kinase
VGDAKPLPEGIRVGPGDDCLVLEEGLVISVDLSIEDVHFRREWISMEEAGWRAAAAALSDLAAMAAEPVGVLVSMAVPEGEVDDTAPALQRGAEQACEGVGARILGGDLSRSPGPVILDVAVLGRNESPLLRGGSLPGDEVWVTGWLGRAGAAVEAWKRGVEPPSSFRAAFARPEPRVRELLWLAAHGDLHAGIDVSDGLAGDSGHLAAASGVAVTLDPDGLPIPPDLEEYYASPEECLHIALRGGEDYEVCVTAPPGALGPLASRFEEEFGIPLSRVGEVEEGMGVHLLGSQEGTEFPEGAFTHFGGGEGR